MDQLKFVEDRLEKKLKWCDLPKHIFSVSVVTFSAGTAVDFWIKNYMYWLFTVQKQHGRAVFWIAGLKFFGNVSPGYIMQEYI